MPLGLSGYLIAIPLELIRPCYDLRSLPELLKNSPLYLRDTGSWGETIRIAMRLSTQRDYGQAIACAKELLHDHDIPAWDMQLIYRVVDWLHDIYGTIVGIYHKLDGRPYREIAFHRLVSRQALYLFIYPP